MKKLSFLTENIIAHRGYFDNDKIAENSVSAFKKAIKYGYPIELDVHILKDEKIIVFHDYNLKRACKINKIVEDCDYEEIKNYTLFNTEEHTPLFEDVLKLIDGRVPILIETKSSGKYGYLEKKVMEILKDYNGQYAFQSFNPFSVLWFKKNAKNVPVGLLSSGFKRSKNIFKKITGKTLLFDLFLKSDFISYDIRNIPNKYLSIKKRKKVVLAWTITNEKLYKKAKKYCDNAICNVNDMHK